MSIKEFIKEYKILFTIIVLILIGVLTFYLFINKDTSILNSTSSNEISSYQKKLDEELAKENDEKSKEDTKKKTEKQKENNNNTNSSTNNSNQNKSTNQIPTRKPSTSKKPSTTKKPSATKKPNSSNGGSSNAPNGISCTSAYSQQKELANKGKASSVVELGGGKCQLVKY